MSQTLTSTTPQQQAVIDAWADMAGWVQDTLPGLAQGTSLPNISQDAGDFGACNAFNGPGNMSGAVWGSDGDANVTLSSLKITTLSGVAIQPAVFTQPDVVQLPFSFAKLDVSGSYGYSQPCALYDLGKKGATSNASGNGTVDQTLTNSSLAYVANFTTLLALSGTTVNGTPAVSVHPDDGGLPSWLASFADFFASFHEADAMKSSIANIFTTASFSQTMIGLLNQKIGG